MSAAKSLQTETVQIHVALQGRDQIELRLQLSEGEIVESNLRGAGCCGQMLKLFVQWRPLLKGKLSELPIPQGVDHASILLREAILKAQGKWDFPFKEQKLCHCRGVAAEVVDRAVIGGCHTTLSVAKQTSAGTSCGTCRGDTEQIIAYRLGRISTRA